MLPAESGHMVNRPLFGLAGSPSVSREALIVAAIEAFTMDFGDTTDRLKKERRRGGWRFRGMCDSDPWWCGTYLQANGSLRSPFDFIWFLQKPCLSSEIATCSVRV